MPEYVNKDYKSLPDPGYVLHYLPYADYQPIHQESIDHPPPVPHHPGAAHILVPGTHPLPPHPLPPLPHHPDHPEVKSLARFHGARVKRSPTAAGQSRPPHPSLNPIIDTQDSETKHNLGTSDLDYYDFEESILLEAFDSFDNNIPINVHENEIVIDKKHCLNCENYENHLIKKSRNLFTTLPKDNFLPSEGNYLTLSNINKPVEDPLSSQSTEVSFKTSPAPFLNLPGSVPTKPSWRFPHKGTANPSTQDWLYMSTSPTNEVYFAPVVSTPAPTGPSGNYEILTNPLHNLSKPVFSNRTNPSLSSGRPVQLSNYILARTKEDLIQEIKEKENQLEKQRLIKQIQEKETELQQLLLGMGEQGLELLEGVDRQGLLGPTKGVWKIQSQVLDGKEVPAGEWILPAAEPFIRKI